MIGADNPTAARLPARLTKRHLTYGLARGRLARRDPGSRARPARASASACAAGCTARRASACRASTTPRTRWRALCVADFLGVPFAEAGAALAAFQGVDRRFSLRGEAGGVLVVDDYGHHPTELAATIAAARLHGRRLLVAFQPHRYTRTRDLLADFAPALGGADRGLPDRRLSRRARRRSPAPTRGRCWRPSRPARRCATSRAAQLTAELARAARPGDLVLCLGAGDITAVPGELLAALGAPGEVGVRASARRDQRARRARDHRRAPARPAPVFPAPQQPADHRRAPVGRRLAGRSAARRRRRKLAAARQGAGGGGLRRRRGLGRAADRAARDRLAPLRRPRRSRSAPRRTSPPTRSAQLAGVELGDRLLAVDPDAVAARVTTHPWILSARVRRELPSTLAIEVTERRAVGERAARRALPARRDRPPVQAGDVRRGRRAAGHHRRHPRPVRQRPRNQRGGLPPGAGALRRLQRRPPGAPQAVGDSRRHAHRVLADPVRRERRDPARPGRLRRQARPVRSDLRGARAAEPGGAARPSTSTARSPIASPSGWPTRREGRERESDRRRKKPPRARSSPARSRARPPSVSRPPPAPAPADQRRGLSARFQKMAGYSGTPLPKKLGIKPGARLGLVGAPDDFAETLGELPDGVVPSAASAAARPVRRDRLLRPQLEGAGARPAGAAGAARARRAASGSPGPRSRPRRSGGLATDLDRSRGPRARASPPASSTTRSAPSTTPGRGCASWSALADRPRNGPGRQK